MKVKRHFLSLVVLMFFIAPGFSQNKLVGEANFRMHGAHVVVEVSVNGSDPVEFAFDTGAQGVMFNEALAENANVKVDGEMPVMGAGGRRMSVKRSGNNVISINGLEFQNTSMVVMNMARFKSAGITYDGILGFPQISQYITEFDYEKSVVRFYEREGYQYNGKGKAVDIDMSFRIPITTAELTLADNTKVEGRIMIDTGATSAVSLNTPVVENNKMIEKAENLFAKQGRGMTGSFDVFESRINAVSLGGYEFTNVPAVLSTSKSGPKANPDFLGVIGNYIMSRFKVTFDYGNGKMYLEPNKAFSDEFQVNCSGITYAHVKTGNNGFVISTVAENSPAAKAGIKKGDELLKVGGKPVTEYGFNELRDFLSRDGKKVTIEYLTNGKVQKAKLSLRKLI